jgi:hypothetical protein
MKKNAKLKFNEIQNFKTIDKNDLKGMKGGTDPVVPVQPSAAPADATRVAQPILPIYGYPPPSTSSSPGTITPGPTPYDNWNTNQPSQEVNSQQGTPLLDWLMSNC